MQKCYLRLFRRLSYSLSEKSLFSFDPFFLNTVLSAKKAETSWSTLLLEDENSLSSRDLDLPPRNLDWHLEDVSDLDRSLLNMAALLATELLRTAWKWSNPLFSYQTNISTTCNMEDFQKTIKTLKNLIFICFCFSSHYFLNFIFILFNRNFISKS